MALKWSDVGIAFAINVGVAFGVFFIFNFLRRLSFVADFYAAKRRLSIPFRFRPPRLPTNLLTWMKPVFKLTDEQFVRIAGMDAFVYHSFLWLCVRMSLWIVLLSFIIILPVNYTGNFVENQIAKQEAQGIDAGACGAPSGDTSDAFAENTDAADSSGGSDCTTGEFSFLVTEFDKTALTNVQNESNRMWAHLILIWVIACLVMHMLWNHYKEMLKWRIAYLSWERKGDTSHTVLVRDIPGTPQGTIVGRIYDNINGTIGKILPNAFLNKVEQAMDEGIAAVFAPVKESVPGKLSGKNPLFEDKTHDIYLDEGEKEFMADVGPEDYQDARSTMGSQSSFTSNQSRAVGKQQSEAEKYGEAEKSAAANQSGSVSAQALDGPALPLKGAKRREALRDVGRHRNTNIGNVPRNVAGRRNLSNFESRRPNTDFDTWRQAEAALQAGLSVEELVTREFKRTFGEHEIDVVRSVRNEKELASLVQQYEQKKTQLEDLTDKWTSTLRRKKPVKRKKVTVRPTKYGDAAVERYGEKKTKVDQMEWKIFELNNQLEKIKKAQQDASEMETSAAFVTFRRRWMQATAAEGLVSYDETFWNVQPAPKPHEIIWNNLALRGWERGSRNLFHWGIVVVIILFFIPIVAALQSVINIQAYAETPPDSNWANWILDQPFLSSILKSILPTLALKICLAVTPILIRLMSKMITRQPCLSGVDFEVGSKYFMFQFFVVFIMNTIVGVMLQGGSGSDSGNNAMIQLFKELSDDPAKIVQWLGSSLPQQASFFMMWILTNGLLARGIKFLKLPGAAIFFLLQRLAGTKRQKKRAYSQQYMNYGDDVADHTLTVLFLLIFAVIQPFVPLCCLLYFVANSSYARYDLLYAFREQFQSGGLMWPVIFDQMYFALLVFLIGNAALLGIKKFFLGPALLIPLIVIVFLFRGAVRRTFQRPMLMLSLHAAADLDRADKEYDWMRDVTPQEEDDMERLGWDTEECVLGPISERYTQPSLLMDQEAHDKTISDAERISQAEQQSHSEREEGNIMLPSDTESEAESVTQNGDETNSQFNDLGDSPILVSGGEVPRQHDNV